MYKRIFFLFIFCIFIDECYSQVAIDTVIENLHEQSSANPSEVLYFQTSKGIYETGEDLWFKVYQLDAQSFGLSDKSKTLYLQMINSCDSIVWQEKYPIESGVVSGHIYIDEKLSNGDYFLFGYTKGSFYAKDTIGIIPSRKVKIVKNIIHAQVPEPPKDSLCRFEIYPEGGNLVAGIPSILAFKATDGNGLPINVDGALFQDGKLITDVKSMHDGMGSILFTPCLGSAYYVELKGGKKFPLQETIHSEGIVMRLIKRNKKELTFLISKSAGTAVQPIYLMCQIRGMLCCVGKGLLKDNLRINIPLDNIPYQGIAEITLFNGNMEPVAERLVYVHPDKKLHVAVELNKHTYTIREKATAKIKVTDESGVPVQANLGISVYERAYSNPVDPVNILTHCYLSSQIRGRIYNPAYYFERVDKERSSALDLLLLTQGWRRYVWAFNNPVYHGEMFLTDEISGVQRIRSRSKRKELQGSEQLVQVSNADGKAGLILADSMGNFTVDADIMNDFRSGYLYLKPLLPKDFKPELVIMDCFPQIDSVRKSRQPYYPIVDLSEVMNMQSFDVPVVSGDSTILLDEVVITRKAVSPFRDKMMGKLDSLAQRDLNPAWVCDCASGTGNGYLNDYRGYSHHPVGCSTCGGPLKNKSVPVKGKSYEVIKYEPVGPKSEWIVTDIDFVVYNGPEFSEEELLRMNNLWRTQGYYAAREFYQPDEIDMQLSTPDARNTLLWAPSIVTDEKGEAMVTFYCSDINSSFVGVIEGVDGGGLLGNEFFDFRVVRY